MPTVAELTAPYGNFMAGPRRGRDVCGFCFNLTDAYSRCYACARGERWVDAMCPISYSIGHEQLHHVLRGYKRSSGATAARFTVELAAVCGATLKRMSDASRTPRALARSSW